jgi:hypothetical protein
MARMSITASLSQSRKQEEIWDAAKAGDEARLHQYLVGATARDFRFEKEFGEKVWFYECMIYLFP